MPIYCLNITSYYERFKKAPRLTVIVDSENFYTSRISSKTVDGYLVTPWVSVTDLFLLTSYLIFDASIVHNGYRRLIFSSILNVSYSKQ